MLIKQIIFIVGLPLLMSCNIKDKKRGNFGSVLITNTKTQDSLFNALMSLIDTKTETDNISDSLTFFILPVEAACPSCRNKSIDSILKYRQKIKDKHFVIITGSDYNKIDGYFQEHKSNLPTNSKRLFIDSSDKAFMHDLVFSEPVIYNTYNKKVIQKTTCIPSNIKEALRHFFSNY